MSSWRVFDDPHPIPRGEEGEEGAAVTNWSLRHKESTIQGAAGQIWNRWESIFPGKFRRIEREYRVYASLTDTEEGENGWAIDYLADYNGRRYIVECDVNRSANDVWHTYKVFGYRAAYCIDRVVKPETLGLMVFFNDKNYSHRVRNMLAVSGVEFCTFAEDGESWNLVRKSLWR